MKSLFIRSDLMYIYLLLACLFYTQGVYGQTAVSGRVIDSTGESLPGVNVVIKGTAAGTQTDLDGNYRISVDGRGGGVTLVFSYVGFETQEIQVGTRTTIDVTMGGATELQEIVVTAFGLEKEKRELTYSTQSVKLDGIAEARPNQNLVNGLQGKVAGLSIQTTGSGVTGGSKVILRGNRSINGNSQALYVVDGVPLAGDINNLSPDDIESISVLKGANAAALYGSRANNGVIIVTTKKGSGDLSININHTTTFDEANILHDFQNQYGQGSGGVYSKESTFAWGPRLDGRSVDHWSPDPNFPRSTYAFNAQPDNVKDFFQTGRSLATNISLSRATENNSTYFSYTHDDRKGIVPGNELTRHNVNLRLENKFNDKLTFQGKLNFIRSNIDNQLATGENFANPVRHAYRLPRNISADEAAVYEYTDVSSANRQHFWKPGDNGGANPWWTVNRNLNETTEDRILGLVSGTYEFLDGLTLMGRVALDRTNSFRENKLYNDSYIIADNGRYDAISSDAHEWNTEFLLSYNKSFDKFSFNINFGGNARDEKQNYLNATSGSDGFFVPNVFAISNAQNINTQSEQRLFTRKVNSLYAFGQVGYLNGLFLDVSFRNDWSSTLPDDNNSFSYPSVGLSAVVSDLLPLPEVFSFLKLRASYAEVGNDTDPYQLSRIVNLSGGFLQLDTQQPNADLKQETTKSIEAGLDLRLLEDKIGIDFTYYKTNSEDQLFAQDVPQGSGIEQRFLNGGDIQNEGVEVVLNVTPIRTSNFSWDVGFNFARNVSKVVELAEGVDELNYGANFLRSFRLTVGEAWGNIYSRGFERDDSGNVLMQPLTTDDGEANPLAGVPLITSGLDVVIGNFNPDWIGGIRNSIRYNNFNLNFVVDIRSGGEVVSFTDAILAADGLTAATVNGRDGSLVFGRNVFSDLNAVAADGSANSTTVSAETLWNNLGGRNAPIGEAFVRSASNVRMREISLGYAVPQSALESLPFKSLKFSVVGRNLFFFSNAAEIIDPEVITASTNGPPRGGTNRPTNRGGITADGFESFAPPTTRSYGFNIQLGF